MRLVTAPVAYAAIAGDIVVAQATSKVAAKVARLAQAKIVADA